MGENYGERKGHKMEYLVFLNENFRVRRTAEQKQAFREYVLKEVNGKGNFEAKVETTKNKKNENIVIGDPLTAKMVCTAHYDTPMKAPFPNIMIPRNRFMFWLYQFVPVLCILAVSLGIPFGVSVFYPLSREVILLAFMALYYGLYFGLFRGAKNPNNFNDNTSGVAVILSVIAGLDAEQAKDVAFILFDNEEKGKKGSKEYFKNHKEEMKDKFLLNFDCVGNGEHVVFVAMEEAEKKAEYELLKKCFVSDGSYQTHFYPAKTSESNSDYKNFPCGVGCMACRQTKGGMLYTPYIHTPKDVVVRQENITFISECMKKMIGEWK